MFIPVSPRPAVPVTLPPMDEKQLLDIEVRADAATPGLSLDARDDGSWRLWVEMGEQRLTVVDQIRFREDALLLRDGPGDVRALLAELRWLRGLVQRAVPYLRNHDDRGPLGEGWQSDELRALIEEMERGP